MGRVFTIGYEGTDIGRFIATLRAVGVEVVADVRAVPLSRKRGFSKTAFQAELAKAGIDYVHFSQLGDPKPGREAARAGRHEEFKKIYSAHLASDEAQDSLRALSNWASKAAVCLVCFEREPKTCHRSMIADKMVAVGFEKFDLFGDMPRRYDNFTALRESSRSRQGLAAAE